MITKVVAIVGSYRKEGTIDHAVEALLMGAREKGAVTQTIHLIDEPIEFCTNCRKCTQQPGRERGLCELRDGLESTLLSIESASAVVLASPVNYYNVTAVYRRFLERTIGYTYQPFGRHTPQLRNPKPRKKAVLVASAGMPGFLIPLFTGAGKALRLSAKMLGATPVSTLWIGHAHGESPTVLSASTLERARYIGWKLA
jgi:multimeric flavodoxin WrbA